MEGSVRASAPKRVRRGDPVSRWLVLAIIAVMIVWLVSLLSAMFFGVVAPSDVPRTGAERDLMAVETVINSGKATPQNYAQYADVLVRVGQTSKAQSVLSSALKTAKTDRSYLLASQADILFSKKDYQGAVTTANKAISEAEKELKAFVDENLKANRTAMAGLSIPSSYTRAALTKASALMASKKYKDAVKAYDAYLEAEPTDSDVLTARAQAKVKAGDKKGAEADYRTALKFVPDYQPAIDGLKQIGASR